MYTIIGGDGREYGPVTADQVRTWVAGGRANKDTKVKLAGTDAWKTVADFPELAGGASPAELTQPPMALSATPLSPRPVASFDVMSCYERSWALLKANFWPFIGVSLIISVIYAVLGVFQNRTHSHGLLSMLFGAPFAGGFYYYFVLKVRGQPATVGDLFSGFSRAFVQLLLAGIVGSILTVLGFVCLLLPGIYLAVAYGFANLLITDKQVAFWDGLETSRKTVTRHWWSVFGLMLLSIPFIILGLVCLGVGIFVALPLIMGAMAYAYEDLFNPAP
jgi:uncharacterized membrane protein YesL